jgi:hypothetical protein
MNGPYSVRVPGPVARPRAGRVGGLAAKALLDPKPITLTATIMWAHWRRPSTIPITVMAGATPPKNIRQAAPVLPRQRQRPSSRQLPRRRSAPGPRPRAPPIMPRLGFGPGGEGGGGGGPIAAGGGGPSPPAFQPVAPAARRVAWTLPPPLALDCLVHRTRRQRQPPAAGRRNTNSHRPTTNSRNVPGERGKAGSRVT